MNLDDLPDVLTVAEVREVLRLGEHTVYALIRTGRLRALRAGRRWIIPKDAVVDFLAGVDNA